MALDDIKSKAGKIDNPAEKVAYLKRELDKIESPETKNSIRKELIEAIKEKAKVKLKNGDPVEYHITYDTFGQSLEPVYFWTLDFMRMGEPSGLGLEVNKVAEEFEASAGGGYFGEMGTRTSVMQDRAMKIMETINAVIKSVINIIYDLKEFEMRLEVYNNLKSEEIEKRRAAQYAIKGIWMDQVDIKMGIGSINNLSRGDLEFVTLRDAFMQAKDEKDVDKMDLNKRVKIVLKRKLAEYLPWLELSERELRKRYDIEKHYLKVQVDSLRLYKKWAKPYLRAAQKLGMKEFNSPDIVAAFNNMQMELVLVGKREIKPDAAFETYKKLNFKNKYYACLEAKFNFRTAPQSVRAQGGATHYAHTGVIDIYFTAYVFTKSELEEIEKQEVFEDMALVEHFTDVSLEALQKDLEHFLEPEEKREEAPKKKPFFDIPNPFKGFKEIFGPLKNLRGYASKYQEDQIKKVAEESSMGTCLLCYDLFKKAHRMVTW
ncbi:MAG: hypothetical protein ABIH25_00940 [Candidatus Woesearchaeota archaeon]